MLPDSDREDPAPESRTGGLVVPPKQMSSALGSLMANYGSMSESESDEGPEGEFATILNLLQNRVCTLGGNPSGRSNVDLHVAEKNT